METFDAIRKGTTVVPKENTRSKVVGDIVRLKSNMLHIYIYIYIYMQLFGLNGVNINDLIYWK